MHKEWIEKSIENIGPINMVVQVEHEEENERLLMLTEQRDDLIKAEKNLLDTIEEIDKIAREKFQKTFCKPRSGSGCLWRPIRLGCF